MLWLQNEYREQIINQPRFTTGTEGHDEELNSLKML